jgi:type II secretory pathway pseudopilin PulG
VGHEGGGVEAAPRRLQAWGARDEAWGAKLHRSGHPHLREGVLLLGTRPLLLLLLLLLLLVVLPLLLLLLLLAAAAAGGQGRQNDLRRRRVAALEGGAESCGRGARFRKRRAHEGTAELSEGVEQPRTHPTPPHPTPPQPIALAQTRLLGGCAPESSTTCVGAACPLCASQGSTGGARSASGRRRDSASAWPPAAR